MKGGLVQLMCVDGCDLPVLHVIQALESCTTLKGRTGAKEVAALIQAHTS
jgi:hypothetical protein